MTNFSLLIIFSSSSTNYLSYLSSSYLCLETISRVLTYCYHVDYRNKQLLKVLTNMHIHTIKRFVS